MKAAAVEFALFLDGTCRVSLRGKQQQACVLLNPQAAGGELILAVLLDPPVFKLPSFIARNPVYFENLRNRLQKNKKPWDFPTPETHSSQVRNVNDIFKNPPILCCKGVKI